MKPIYLDYAATTPVDPRVAAKMAHYLTADGAFGNPASLHAYGKEAKAAVETAREQVADFIKAMPEEIIFTSGATESNNLALKGVARLYQRRGKHIITMRTEHKAVLDTCQYLEKQGFRVTYLSPLPDGTLCLDALKAAICDDTILVSVMHVNNETGVIQPVHPIARLTREHNVLLHIDAAQSAAKIPIHVGDTPIDLLSLSAHKMYGPKGVGALFLRKKPRIRVEPLLHGGGHEQGMRSGTLATHQIVGLGEAASLAKAEMERDMQHIQQLHTRVRHALQPVKEIIFNTPITNAVPHILNLRFKGMIADAILAELPGIAASTASACQGQGTEGSYVLRAMGLSLEEIKSSLRFSFGRFTTEAEVTEVIASLLQLFNNKVTNSV